MKFRSDLIANLFLNQGDVIGQLIRSTGSETNITVAQGYGVAERIPLRLLSYLVPTLRIASQLPPQTKIELYVAQHGVMRANPHYDSEKIKASAVMIAKLLHEYVQRFHPNLAGRVTVLQDEPLTREALMAIDGMLPSAMEIVALDSTIKAFVEKRGGEAAIRYMTEHVLYMRDPFMYSGQLLPVLVPGMSDPSGGRMIMVGGPAEKVFHRFRQQLASRISAHTHWESSQFFTPVGELPTYHPQPGEPVLGEVQLNTLTLDTIFDRSTQERSSPLKDWRILLQDVAGVEKFQNPQSEVDVRILKHGLENLLRWFDGIV